MEEELKVAKQGLLALLFSAGWKRVRDDAKKSKATIDVREATRVRANSEGKAHDEPYRMWRCTIELAVPINAVELWVTNSTHLKEWNPVLEESKILASIDADTFIVSYIFKPLAGGLVSAREFTVLCRKETLPNHSRLLTASGHRLHQETKNMKGMVHGWTGPSGFLLEVVDKDRCRMTWIINSDSKLSKSLPKPIIDKAFVKLLLTMLRNLRARTAPPKK